MSTSTELSGTKKVTPPVVTPLVDNGASTEESLTRIVDSLGEHNEQMSIRMKELERAVHVDRESLREEINLKSLEVSKIEKRLKERTQENLVRNFARMTREPKQREQRSRADLEKLRNKQEQTLGILDTRTDSMMERRSQAKMDRMACWETGANLEKDAHTRERLVESRERTSMGIQTEEGHKGPQEEEVTLSATQLAV